MSFDINNITRKNILSLKPYSSARDEFSGDAAVFLDANENPFNTPWNRYPDPRQSQLKAQIAKLKPVEPSQIFLGNGSDEPIDLLFRAFCEPGIDNIVSIAPTYGMYRVAADINNIEVIESHLSSEFELEGNDLLAKVNENTKLIFLCSPNNPSGNLLDNNEIKKIILSFKGLVVVDEAYIDFCPERSLLPEIASFPNLVILQTFSKAWGMAGLRLGMAFAAKPIIDVLNKIKYPYNLSILTQQKAIELIQNENNKTEWVDILLKERDNLIENLHKLTLVKKIFRTDSNFILIKVEKPVDLYNYLVGEKIIVRDRSRILLCEGCLRITVGSTEENQQLISVLQNTPSKFQ